MKITGLKYSFLLRKCTTMMLLSASFAAFATLGKISDRDTVHHNKSLLSVRTPVANYNTFSLRSGYNYRGNSVISNNTEDKYFFVNRVITYEKGNQTYILPMKKRVLLDKVNFSLNQR